MRSSLRNKKSVFTSLGASSHAVEEREKYDYYATEPKAIELLQTNPDKISWNELCANPCKIAMRLIEENQDKINWYSLSLNPSIFYNRWMEYVMK